MNNTVVAVVNGSADVLQEFKGAIVGVEVTPNLATLFPTVKALMKAAGPRLAKTEMQSRTSPRDEGQILCASRRGLWRFCRHGVGDPV